MEDDVAARQQECSIFEGITTQISSEKPMVHC
jgi:hypothetical protein